MATPTLLAHPDSSIGKRAGFARHNLWVTPYRPEERYAAGDYPNQHPTGDGLPTWTAADRPIADTDLVAWYVFAHTHVPRPETAGDAGRRGRVLAPPGFFGGTRRSTCRPSA
jgi:primary-amine oxidase